MSAAAIVVAPILLAVAAGRFEPAVEGAPPAANGAEVEPTAAVSPTAPVAPAPTPADPADVDYESTPPEIPEESPSVATPTEDAADAEATGPSELPPESEPSPTPSQPRAIGGVAYTPLPEAPPPEDPATVRSGPWRGRWWFGISLGATIPLGGTQPAAARTAAAVGGVSAGYRPLPFLGVYTAVTSAAHDRETQMVVLDDGTMGEELDFGRLTMLDLATVRLYLPRPRRWEPWVDVGGGVGLYRAPFTNSRRAMGLARAAVGMDIWLATRLTLGIHTAYRLTTIDGGVGHGLRTAVDFSVHW